MTNNYQNWSTLSNPSLGTFTNTLVNYNAGVVVQQSSPSALHSLPASFIGKLFTIQNATSSAFPVSINGYTIDPGETGSFYWNGASWDIIAEPGAGASTFTGLPDGPGPYTGQAGKFVRVNGSETGLEYASGSGGGDGGSVGRTISFSDPADVGSNIYNIGGALAANTRVERVVVEVVVPFNDPFATDLSVIATAGFTTLAQNQDIDLSTPGVYIRELPGTQISNGQIRAQFSADPNGSGGTQGQLRIYIEYGLL